MEKRGIKTERGNINRHIALINQQIQDLIELIRKGANLVKEEMEKAKNVVVNTVRKNPAAANKPSIREQLKVAQKQADEYNAQRGYKPKPKNQDRGL